MAAALSIVGRIGERTLKFNDAGRSCHHRLRQPIRARGACGGGALKRGTGATGGKGRRRALNQRVTERCAMQRLTEVRWGTVGFPDFEKEGDLGQV
jgi:hypothetical protein